MHFTIHWFRRITDFILDNLHVLGPLEPISTHEYVDTRTCLQLFLLLIYFQLIWPLWQKLNTHFVGQNLVLREVL